MAILCVRPCTPVCAQCMNVPSSTQSHSFEVYHLYRSLAENTGMAICDTIDTWHVNIDSNSRCDAPCRFALSYLLGFLATDTVLQPPSGPFSLNFDGGKSLFSARTDKYVTYFTNFLHSFHKGCWFWAWWLSKIHRGKCNHNHLLSVNRVFTHMVL